MYDERPVIRIEAEDKLGLPDYVLKYSDREARKNYLQRMEEEGLFHREQPYKNMMVTVGDTWRYLPFVLAWTDTNAHVTLSHRELVPYGVRDKEHERGHSVLMGEVGDRHSEHDVDRLVDDPSRNYKLDSVRLKY